MISNEQFSGLIGRIYDCTLEPDGWPETMGEICRAVDCAAAAIMLIDLQHSQHHFFRTWNLDPYWLAAQEHYYDDITFLHQNSPLVANESFGEPLVHSREIPEEVYRKTRFFQEWVRPQGFHDSMQVVVLHEPPRIGAFAVQRRDDVGLLSDEDIAVMQLLAPHICRAVAISDLMDMKTLEVQALAASLDAFAAGIVVVADDSRILHVNLAAQAMLEHKAPIRSVNGRLTASDPIADGALARAVVIARRNEPEIGSAGIGVALRGDSGEIAVAHVLPLASGELRTRLVPQATAAVFVTHAASRPALDTAAIAVSVGLTQAEARLLEQLAGGATLANAAVALGIAETTAKTHLSHIFSKTGVSRQTDLIALVHRLTPPVRVSSRVVT